MENLLIIGNGFDLDLGLPTKYSDFAKSEYWPSSPDKKSSKLEESVNSEKNKETWFDLEKTLLEYSMQYKPRTPNYALYNRETQDEITNNIAYYNRLRDSLNKYISHAQENTQIKKDCTASSVLLSIINNEYFYNIYSFNYTDLNSIARQIGITQEIKYYHLHGKASNGSIILGVDETKLRKGYECLHKTSSRYYRSHDLYNALTKSTEIVIFGLSFGKIDYSYLDMFFKKISGEDLIAENKKQYITIFTKDDKSRLDVVNKLRDMGINMQRLHAQSHFQIICTSDDVEKQELSNFYNRLEEHSKSEDYKKLSRYIS